MSIENRSKKKEIDVKKIMAIGGIITGSIIALGNLAGNVIEAINK